MPRKKSQKRSIKRTSPKIKKIETKLKSKELRVFSDLKMSESYVSLFLGALVVFIFALILFLFLKGSGNLNKVQLNPRTGEPAKEAQKKMQSQKTYIVMEGEGLFEIAEKVYGNGDYWINIAQANNLSNPDQIETGMKLIIPEIKK